MNRYTLSVALLLGVVTASQLPEPLFLSDLSDAYKVSCYIYKDLTYFDLTHLYKNDTGFTYGTYSFNFCKPLTPVTNTTANTTSNAYAYSTDLITEDISIYADGTDLIADNITVYDLDGVRNVQYSFDSDTECPSNSSRTLSATYKITCNSDGKKHDDIQNLKVTDLDSCSIEITGSHQAGCAVFQATAIVEFLTNNPWIIGSILIAFGVISTFLGGKFFPYVLATVAGGITFFVVIVFASALGLLNALDSKTSATTAEISYCILSFFGALTLAILVGWFIRKVRRIGGTILGAAAGFFLGYLLYNLVFAQWWNNTFCLIFLAFGLAVAVGTVSWKFDKIIIVYLTAFVGGYALVRGISVFAGHFPNEITTFQEIQAGTFNLDNYFYIYLVSFAVATLLGVITQFKLKLNEHHHDDGYSKIN